MLKLYNYFRSSASFRVRIALNLKNLGHELHTVDLSKKEQFSEEYLKLSPQGLVPVLIDGEYKIVQSLAILEYLEEAYPATSLLPAFKESRAKIRGIMQIIACEIQPTGNLAMRHYLRDTYHVDEAGQDQWSRAWIDRGFAAIEILLKENKSPGKFCYGDTPTLADVCLFPQVFNAKRFGCDMNKYPRIKEIAEHCETMEYFFKASPTFGLKG